MNIREQKIIGMLHIPISNILTGKSSLHNGSSYPFMKKKDYSLWRALASSYNKEKKITAPPEYAKEFPGVIALSNKIDAMYEIIKRLSFIEYLYVRLIKEADLYSRCGIGSVLLENVGAPYTARNEVPLLEQITMSYLTGLIRRKYPQFKIGIQILAYGDNISLEIALRNRCEFIRGESFVFHGQRPDALNAESGTLKKVYVMRQYFNIAEGKSLGSGPKIYTDLKKKHTLFDLQLHTMEKWLENIEFCKLEGVVISGKATGIPVNFEDAKKCRAILDEINSSSAFNGNNNLSIPLIAGSGCTRDNVREYLKYFDKIIIGSSIKKDNYWENEIDESQLEKLIEKTV